MNCVLCSFRIRHAGGHSVEAVLTLCSMGPFSIEEDRQKKDAGDKKFYPKFFNILPTPMNKNHHRATD
jgi:hypothetical protein